MQISMDLVVFGRFWCGISCDTVAKRNPPNSFFISLLIFERKEKKSKKRSLELRNVFKTCCNHENQTIHRIEQWINLKDFNLNQNRYWVWFKLNGLTLSNSKRPLQVAIMSLILPSLEPLDTHLSHLAVENLNTAYN